MRVFNWMLPNKTNYEVIVFLVSVGSAHCGAIYENLLVNEHIVPILEPIEQKFNCCLSCCL